MPRMAAVLATCPGGSDGN